MRPGRGYQAGDTPVDQLKPPPSAMVSGQVRGGDVARQAIERLNTQLEKVRRVLEYCESKAPKDEDGVYEAGYYESLYTCPAYDDVARQLKAALDGGGV